MIYTNKKEIDNTLLTKSPCNLDNQVEKKRSSLLKYAQKRTYEERKSIESETRRRQRTSQSSDFSLVSMTTEERIDFYQQKYTHIIEAESQLRAWIQSNKVKEPPLPPSNVRGSIDATLMVDKRKSLLLSPKQESEMPLPKSSFSTFLKKAMRPSESTLSKQIPSKTTSKKNRFSLTNSLNRLSLSKNYKSAADNEEVAKIENHLGVNSKHSLEKPPLKRDGIVKRKKIQRNLPVVIECTDSKRVVMSDHSRITMEPSVFLDRLQRNHFYEDIECHSVGPNVHNSYDSFGRKQMSKSLTPSSQRLYQKLAKEEMNGISFLSDNFYPKSSTFGKNSRLKQSHALQSLADKYKSTFSQPSERKSRISFSLASSLSAIRFTPTSKRQSALA